jgi:MinD-like ATPase involved in chromosome partitioning or flagellar assembly
MVTFDEVLETLLQICEDFPGFDKVQKATVVRDLRGRVRLAMKCEANDFDKAKADDLEGKLKSTLGAWFAGPILGPESPHELKRLQATVLDQGIPWPDAKWEDLVAGTTRTPAHGKWQRIERRLSKLAWMDEQKASPPWPLVRQKPSIVTFYSFKGGVGRTTLLASTAWQLAADGKRVVVIDLDVEAPGLSSLLGAESPRGVVDFLVDHLATGTANLDGLLSPAKAFLDAAAGLVEVIIAGNLNASYFEKLARLDFTGSGLTGGPSKSPVRDGLLALLKEIARRDPPPDYILIDSRAGLHDVAGLSLHDLAHVDVLVGRDSDQAYQGLDLTVEALGRRRHYNDLRCVVVQAMAPDDPGSEEYKRIASEYRQRSYAAFVEDVYSNEPNGPEGTEEMQGQYPDVDDNTAAHYPSVVRFNQRLLHFSSIEARREELFGADFKEVKERIVERASPES